MYSGLANATNKGYYQMLLTDVHITPSQYQELSGT